MKDRKFTFDSENLAFPEIHTGKVKQNDVAEDNTDSTVVYDTVVVPEVHLKSISIKSRRKTIINNSRTFQKCTAEIFVFNFEIKPYLP